MSASIANEMGVDFHDAWSGVRRPAHAAARPWALALSVLVHVAVIGSIATFLINRPELTEAPPQEAVEMVFSPPPPVPVPEPTNKQQAASPLDVAPPDEDVATPAAPVPPPPLLVRPPVKPLPRHVVAHTPEPPATAAPTPFAAPGAPLVPARPVTGVESDHPPAYPMAARRRDEQGRVLVKVDVSADGSPAGVTVAQGSGFPVLDEAALGAVKQWRFVPATRGGTPVSAVALVPVLFRLAD